MIKILKAAAMFVCASAVVLSAASCKSAQVENTSGGTSIVFDENSYVPKTINVNGTKIKIRAYENIVYVKNPVDTKYEAMNIYIPEEYFSGGIINGYTSKTAPIFLPNQIGGYMPATPGVVDDGTNTDAPAFGPGRSGPNSIALALANGMVVASPGARGRTSSNGKAPSCIVDLKAAVRYLRYNDKIIPGDSEKIISNGTSAGGALSSLLGASGNSKDYEPYLKELGAAEERDDIYAVSAYCPITNLENANTAYEWMFNNVYEYQKIEMTMLDYHMERKVVKGELTEDQIKISKDLAAMFPDYVNSLNLKLLDGTSLTLDSDGNGTFKDYVKSVIISSAQKALDSGKSMSNYSWVTVENGKVTDVDFESYKSYLGRMKTPGAFDAVDLSTGENQLFGTSEVDKKHFTDYALEHDTANGTMADSSIVKMMNAMNYVSSEGASKYWRIRAGTKDSDTASAISALLSLELQMNGKQVDYALPWDVPHSGDYDLPELFEWINQICK